MLKTCSRCHEAKPRTQFYRDARASDGLNSHCKTCHLRAMNAYNRRLRAERRFLVRVLEIFDEAGMHGDLFWRVKDDAVKLYAMCNDTFYWGVANAEEITPERLPILEQAAKDAQAIDTSLLVELYAARVLGMRPQRAWFKGKSEAVTALFEACGPERDTKDEG